MKEPKFVTIGDVAAELSLHNSTVYRLVVSGTLPGYRVGRRLLVKRTDLDDFLRQRRITTPWAKEQNN